MFIWLKINNTYGFVGMSYGYDMSDIDNYLSPQQFNDLLNDATASTQLQNMMYNVIDDLITTEAIEFFANKGWIPNDKFDFISIGDCSALCFEKSIVKKSL